MNLDEMELDELYELARDAARQQRRAEHKKPKAVEPVEKVDPRATYTKPENWVAGRSITLIHMETQTVLGVFVEWLHRWVPDTRRLVRAEEGSTSIQVEYVSGQWGAPSPVAKEAYLTGSRRIELVLPVILSEPSVGAICEVSVVLDGTAVLRVETVGQQAFYSAAHNGDFLVLPLGTNIFPVMTYATKADLYDRIQK